MSLEIDGTLEETETFVNSLKLLKKDAHGADSRALQSLIRTTGQTSSVHS